MSADLMLRSALAYAERFRWPVFPVMNQQKNKKPLVKSERRGEGGYKLATTDVNVITGWWTHWPWAMIGVPTGQDIGAIVIDIDGSAGREPAAVLRDLEAQLGEQLPETWLAETPRGGWHFYLRTPELIGNRGGMIPDVDVRGSGKGYVAVPPSVLDDGRKYTWIRRPEPGEREPPGAVSPALLDMILKRGKWAPEEKPRPAPAPVTGSADVDEAIRKYGIAALDAEIRKVEGAPAGTRNNTLNEAAFALGTLVGAGVLSESVVAAALESAASRWPNPAKSRGTIRSGLEAGKAKPRDLADIKAKAAERKARRHSGASVRQRPQQEAAPRPKPAPAPPEAIGFRMEGRLQLRAARRRPDPEPLTVRNGAPPGKWTPDELGLPAEDPCPVIPLGREGDRMWLLDSDGQLVARRERDWTHAGIQFLFASAPNYPEWAWPRLGRKVKWTDEGTGEEKELIPIKSFEDDQVRKALFEALSICGPFSPDRRVRGRGAWKLADGSLVYHAGEELWTVDGGRPKARQTGLLADGRIELVLPRMVGLPPPWPDPVEPEDNPARELIAGLRGWAWERPDVDPVLLLGWIGVAFLGGALDWRSAIFLVGDKGTGKSTLQELIKELFGDALLDSANATPASIYQALAHDSRAVALDELEGSADQRKATGIIELARQASSGAIGMRGTSDAAAGGVEFQVRSAFLFSAINNPPLLPQDLSRIALLRLRELDPTAGPAPAIVDADTCGRKILTRLMCEWHRWPQTLAAYREALAAGGHSGRGQMTYGTLLAAADLILGPELADELGIPMSDDLSPWSELLHVDTLPEVADALPNWRSCLSHMFQSRVDAWRSGERATVGQLLDDLEVRFGGQRRDGDGLTPKYAERQLAQAGLGLVFRRSATYLAVPHQSPALERLFQGSRWQGMPGAGGWSEALRQGPPYVCVRDAGLNRVRINGIQQRCTMIHLQALHALDPAPAPDGVDHLAAGG